MKAQKENIKIIGLWKLRKFANKEEFEKGNAFFDKLIGKNLLLNEGINELWTILCSAGGTKFDNTNAYIGVGDSDTAASADQTGLLAVTNKAYIGMDTSFPTFGTDQKATWRATFNGSTANFDWNEFTVANGNSNSAKNLNRLVSAQGTKASGQIWQLDVEITLVNS
mgnify:FL=1